jgi:hypothetical protein
MTVIGMKWELFQVMQISKYLQLAIRISHLQVIKVILSI